jgi:hypothetical protein
MHDLEQKLQSALKRQEAPEQFADRIMARVSQAPKPRAGLWPRFTALLRVPQFQWAAAGALALALVVGGMVEHHRIELERAQGEAAKIQLKQALRLASSKLNGTWRKATEPERRTPPS